MVELSAVQRAELLAASRAEKKEQREVERMVCPKAGKSESRAAARRADPMGETMAAPTAA